MCCIKVGYSKEVDRYLPKVEKYLDNISDERQYAHGLMSISQSYRDVKDYDKAIYYANKSLEVFGNMEDKELLAKMKMNLGIIYCDKEDIDKSNYYLSNCEILGDSLESDDRSRLMLKLAQNYKKQNKFDDAVCYIEKSFKTGDRQKNIGSQVECYKCLYEIYMMNKNYKECENILKNELALLETVDMPKALVECYIDMGEYYNLIGDKHLAVEFMNKGLRKLEDFKKENII
jgi:tetratricopeptide (TPR) repeat protein